MRSRLVVDPLDGYREEITQLLMALTQAIEDMGSKTSLPYLTDYSLVSPFAWPRLIRTPSANEGLNPVKNLDFLGSRLFNIFPQLKDVVNFDITFALPTILELESAMLLQMERSPSVDMLKDISERDFENFRREIDDTTNGMYITHDKAARRLAETVNQLSAKPEQNNVLRVIELLRDKFILGLGDVLSPDEKKKLLVPARAIRNEIYSFIKPNYSSSDSEDVLRDFAALMDATTLSLAAQSAKAIGRELPFLGSVNTKGNQELVKLIGTRRRLPLTAVLILNAANSLPNEKRNKKEITAILRRMQKDATNCLQNLSRVDKYSDLMTSEQDELSAFYIEHMGDFAMSIKEIKKLYNKDSLREKMQNFPTRFDMVRAEREIEEEMSKNFQEWHEMRSSIVPDSEYDDFDVRQDPRVQQILSASKGPVSKS